MAFSCREGHIYFKRDNETEVLLGQDLILNDLEALEFFQFIKENHNLFHKSRSLFENCRPFTPLKGEKIVLFPGTFSPWHEGHEACVVNLPDHSQVAVIPDYNPWKDVRDTDLWKEVCAIWSGLEKINLKECDEKKINVSLYLGFLTLKEKNPTISWLGSIPFKEKWLLMGEDTFLNIDKWSEAKELLSQLTGLYVCPRAENKASVLSQRSNLQSFAKELQIEFLEPHPYQHYSSTYLRNQDQ